MLESNITPKIIHTPTIAHPCSNGSITKRVRTKAAKAIIPKAMITIIEINPNFPMANIL